MSSQKPSQRATIESVARHAGVSRQTVSNALNAPEKLRPDTLERVLKSIADLGYSPSQAARNLRTQATRLIGFRLAHAWASDVGAIAGRFLDALSGAARDRGYDILVFSAAEDDDEIAAYDDLMRRGATDAFVLMQTHGGDSRTEWLRKRGVPFIAFGRPWDRRQTAHNWVDVDGYRGMRLTVDHLVEQGHRRIGFVGWPSASEVGEDRRRGWLEGCQAHRLPTQGLETRAANGIATGTLAAEELLSLRRPPTALACVSDAMAVGAMRAIEHRGLRVGTDVGVVGFDDSPLATVVAPGLSSVRQPLEALAEKTIDVLVTILDGSAGSTAGSKPVKLLFPPSLIVRESSFRI
jgi:DNA-binding LacI/PurR family transcriptional regulator